MADANTTAPLKKEEPKKEVLLQEEKPFGHDFLNQKFDPKKRYVFELLKRVSERELPVIDVRANRPLQRKKHKPFQNVVLSSQIVWDGQRRNIRYYDGCNSIFVDEQPKDKELIDSLIKQTQKRAFIDGKFGVYGDERMLLLFMLAASFNSESQFRTRTADMIYKPLDSAKAKAEQAAELDLIDQALKLAREASEEKMLIHAEYLGLPTIDLDTTVELTPEEIRVLYRKAAASNSKKFIESYGNKDLELKHYIKKAWEQGVINNQDNKNKASWKSGKEICDISGLKSFEAITDKLFDFAKTTEEGENFAYQLAGVMAKK